MEITHAYPDTKFSFAVIRAGFELFRSLANPKDGEKYSENATVQVGYRRIRYDDLAEAGREYGARDLLEARFLAHDYRSPHSSMNVLVSHQNGRVQTAVSAEGLDRAALERIHQHFADAAPQAVVKSTAKATRPTVFIGHGRSQAWRDLKDHLADQHGYKIEAYETGARAGHTIRDILASMAKTSTFALLVMTGEDEQADGSLHARQNVIHEVGLFQGSLGFDRAIVLLENGTEEFSNLYGIQQIRFDQGRIRETFGDVLATLRREFP